MLIVPITEARKGNFSLFNEWNTNWNEIAPISFLYERDTPRSKNISEELRKFYFSNQNVSLTNLQGMADVSFNLERNSYLYSFYI